MTSGDPNIGATLIGFITSELLGNRPGLSLQPEDDLLASGLLDSLAVMRLIRFIESQFELSVPPADVTIENFGKVAAMDAYLRARGV